MGWPPVLFHDRTGKGSHHAPTTTTSAERSPRFHFPSAYTILYALIVIIAGLTWVIPAGQYERVASEALGKDVPVAGTYAPTDANPQGFFDVILAPIAGFYDPGSYSANAIDVALFVLMIGGFIGVVTATGAIDAGIKRAMARLKGREKWMIPILMALFAAGGSTYGMAEETLAFYVILTPVMIAAGYDALTAVAVILLGAGVGVLGSTVNAFSTVIASDAAGVPFTDGLMLRLVLLALTFAAAVTYVMRYTARIKADPSRSLVFDRKAENEAHFLSTTEAETSDFTGLHKIVLLLFGATFAVMIWGVSLGGWWMAEMSGLFLFAGIGIGIDAVGGRSHHQRQLKRPLTDNTTIGASCMTSAPHQRRNRYVTRYDPDYHSCDFSARRIQRTLWWLWLWLRPCRNRCSWHATDHRGHPDAAGSHLTAGIYSTTSPE